MVVVDVENRRPAVSVNGNGNGSGRGSSSGAAPPSLVGTKAGAAVPLKQQQQPPPPAEEEVVAMCEEEEEVCVLEATVPKVDPRLMAFKTRLSQAVASRGGGEDQIEVAVLRSQVSMGVCAWVAGVSSLQGGRGVNGTGKTPYSTRLNFPLFPDAPSKQLAADGCGAFTAEEVASYLKALEADNHLMLVGETVYIV